jgi:hypothetical protein
MSIKNLITGETLEVGLFEFVKNYKNAVVTQAEATAKNLVGTPKYQIANIGAPPTITTNAVVTPNTNIQNAKTAKKGCGCK